MAAKKKLPTGITLTPTGGYMVRPYDRVTKKKGKAKTFAKLSEAVEYKEKVDAGKIRTGRKEYTCDGWVEHWTDPANGFSRPKESTNLFNKERVSLFATDFKGVLLTDIDRQKARQWANKHPYRVSSVRTMLNDALADGLLESNPFANLRISKGPGRKHNKPLTEKEVRELAAIASKKWEDWPVMSAMILFSAYTGLRRGETLGLKWTDIDWEAGTVTVERQWAQRLRAFSTTKNDSTRIIPLPGPAAEALRTLDRNLGPSNGVVWYSRQGKFMEVSLHDYYWRQIVNTWEAVTPDERVKDVDLEWHSLRHFTASWLVDRGVLPHDAGAMLGHTDGGRLIQELYGHLYEDNSIKRIQASLAA